MGSARTMKVSIITVAYNAAHTLADTLESVARQTHANIEHWVVDGGSSDHTRQVIQKHGRHLAGFICEPDRGLYDAMNKGAGLATGEVVAFLNADDWYAHDRVVASVEEAFSRGADLVYGDLAFVSPEAPFETRRVWLDADHNPSDFFYFGWQPAHPTTFILKSVFKRVGGFDLRWRIAADYAFLGRAMCDRGLRLEHIPQCLVNMRLGGLSTGGVGAIFRANAECASALRQLRWRWPYWTIALKLARKMPQLGYLVRRDSTLSKAWRPWSTD